MIRFISSIIFEILNFEIDSIKTQVETNNINKKNGNVYYYL